MTDGSAPPLPNFVLIGAQRGGSTFLHACLGAHPDVFMHRWEEGYFADGFYERYDETWLRSLFADAGEATARGLRGAIFLGQPESIPRIVADLPGVRLVAVLREPVSRAISTFHHYVGLGVAPLVPLADGFRQLLDGTWRDRYPATDHILGYSEYGTHLDHVRHHVPDERLLVLTHDELRADLGATLATAYEFLDVDPGFRPERPTDRANASTTNRTRLRIRRSGNRFVFANTHDLATGFVVRDTLVGRALAAAATRLETAIPPRWFPNEAPALPPDLEAELVDRFAPHVRRVEEHLGRELPTWHRGTR